MKKTFQNEVMALIAKKHEGSYWDFKREWYSNGHSNDLLHDIICMANNLSWRDAYIIVGVDEENDYSICDTSNDPNRKNTQTMVTFLRDKHFAGEIRPNVEVKSIEFQNGTIDIIVISSTRNTPYYLTKSYNGVFPYHIYSRIQDTNTPIDKSADLNVVEKLWANHFSLNTTALERAKKYLEKPDDWIEEETNESSYYHKIFPEFRLTYELLDDRNGSEYYLFGQFNNTPHWYEIKLLYHQTILFSCIGAGLDSGCFLVPCPEIEFIHSYQMEPILIGCYVKQSLHYILHEFLLCKKTSLEAYCANIKFMKCIVVFNNELEKKRTLQLADNYIDQYDVDVHMIPYFSKSESTYKESYIAALKTNTLLDKFREELRLKIDLPTLCHEVEKAENTAHARLNYEHNQIIVSFDRRPDVEINLLTPWQQSQIKTGEMNAEDIADLLLSVKRIAHT